MNELGNDRIMVLRVKLLDDTYVYIIGVYLPTTSEPADTFNYHLKLLEDVSLELCNNGSIIILGDLNAHIGQLAGERSFTKINSRGRCVHRVLDDLNLISVNSQSMCKGPIETFYGSQGFIITTIDHIFVPREFSTFIAEYAVIEDCSTNG
jgi:endonuclease/exonuclease/phosphatase (EEP) superfamily protein YafD